MVYAFERLLVLNLQGQELGSEAKGTIIMPHYEFT
jgi:hypothetical protein